jgi:hypothetical protein
MVAYAEGRYQQAYDLAAANGTEYPQRFSVLMATLAALELQRWDDATRLCQAMVGFRSRLGLGVHHAVARVLLGRAHAAAGRAAEARKAYEEAFGIWKDADADLPLLLEARKDYQRLSS